jgi:pimeloyl-ACP methyl ester carboxylesterase
MELETVTSRDGTRIAYHRLGQGPPLVLVPGTGAANPAAWTRVTPKLAARFTVCAVDRRGHGASGDGADYALAREAEDLAAVVDAQGAPAALLGHSFGALAALEAALLTPNIRRLLLYEPVFALGGAPLYPPGMIERYEALLAAGDHAGGLGRELRAEQDYGFDAGRLQSLALPTLLLLGGDSEEFLAAPTRALHAALPHSRVAALAGQQHIAMYTAPELFAQAVLAFLEETG